MIAGISDGTMGLTDTLRYMFEKMLFLGKPSYSRLIVLSQDSLTMQSNAESSAESIEKMYIDLKDIATKQPKWAGLYDAHLMLTNNPVRKSQDVIESDFILFGKCEDSVFNANSPLECYLSSYEK